MSKIRLFVALPTIKANQIVEINDNDFNYLTRVMRKKVNDQLLIFNGCDGLWLAKINQINKKNCQIEIAEKIQDQYYCPNITLAFSPVKNARIDFIAAKATELGVSQFQPIISQYNVVNKVNLERFKANVKEAAEQCQRLDLPKVLPPIKLELLLKNLAENNQQNCRNILILCDESGKGQKASEILPKILPLKNHPAEAISTRQISDSKVSGGEILTRQIIIFIGPEGGFSAEEFNKFEQNFAGESFYKLNLGPRILRADTAIIAALTLVQEFLGDFNLKPAH